MSEVQNEPVEPFRLHDPTKEGPVPTVNDKPLAAADVQRLIDESITEKFASFQAELLHALKPANGGQSDCADTRAPSITARGGGTAAAAGSRSAKPAVGDLLGLSSGAASGEDTEESQDNKSVTSSSDSYGDNGREGYLEQVLLTVGKPDPDHRYSTSRRHLSGPWNALLRFSPGATVDSEVVVRFCNAAAAALRAQIAAVRLISETASTELLDEKALEVWGQTAEALHAGISANYDAMAYMHILKCKGAEAANAIAKAAVEHEANYATLGDIPLAGQHRDLVHRLDRDQARKDFNALTKSTKSRGGAATNSEPNLISKAEANRQANSRADSLRNELKAAALQVAGLSEEQKGNITAALAAVKSNKNSNSRNKPSGDQGAARRGRSFSRPPANAGGRK